jgi:hypothetical protein
VARTPFEKQVVFIPIHGGPPPKYTPENNVTHALACPESMLEM